MDSSEICSMTLAPNTQITQANVGDWVRYDGHLLRVVGFGDEPILDFAGWHRNVCSGACVRIGPDLGDGWIGWGGGREPVPHDTPGLIVRCRNGAEHIAAGFASHYWQHDGDGCDIVAFKFSRPALSPPASVIQDSRTTEIAPPDELNTSAGPVNEEAENEHESNGE